ncbi:unnamed protein product, partial [Prorocentrum cordatum]
VKARLGQPAVADGLITRTHANGNLEADQQTKEGAQLVRARPGDTLTLEGCHHMAKPARQLAGTREAMLSERTVLDSVAVELLGLLDP